MEVIQISGYTLAEKLEIARRYRVPRQVRDHGLKDRLDFTDDALRRIVTEYTREAGVRSLDREISKAIRKSTREFLDTPWQAERLLDADAIRSLLGVPPFRDDQAERQPQLGLTHGLAWTSVGGVTLDIEAVSLPGEGKVTLTGQLGDVMKESAQAGIAFLRGHAADFGLEADFHSTRDLHVHVLEGATPKDGPSAGIAIASAVVSALSGQPLRGDVAMTGEITLRGRVLPIGGLKEKLLAAHQAGILTVIIPEANRSNLEEVPEAVLQDLEVITVSDFSQVMATLLQVDVDSAGFVPAAHTGTGQQLPPPATAGTRAAG
jgi:ATP-dependent Lon protease